MFVHALVITAGLGALLASGILVSHAVARGGRTVSVRIAMIAYASVALAGSVAFCHDLIAHRALWSDDSTAIAVLNFVGVLMMHSFTLLPAIIGCAWLYVAHRSRARRKREDDQAPVES